MSDEPIEGVVISHPIPQTHFGFDVGPGGKVYIAPVNSTLKDGEWRLLGYAVNGVKFNDE